MLIPREWESELLKKKNNTKTESVLVPVKLVFSAFDFERAAINKQRFSHRLLKVEALEKQQVKVLPPTEAKQTKNPNQKPKQNQIIQLITWRFRFCAFVINLFLAANCSKSKVTKSPSFAFWFSLKISVTSIC